MIELRNVSFTYGTDTEEKMKDGNGIKELNLTIQNGEFIVLTGGSGCGKTTVTRLVNGLIPNYYNGTLTGEVLLDGQCMSHMPISETAKRVGSVFQNPRSQFFNVDTTSELAFASENQGLPVPEIEKRIEYAVSQLHIEELLGRSLFQLSGGEKQKIACASVAAACSEIIVLDEPSSNLDIYAIEDLKEILSKWKQQGKTIIIAEHRLHFLRNLADRMIVMDKGEIVKELNQREILKLSVEDTGRMGIRPLRMEELHCTGDRGDSRKHDISLNGISYHYPGTKKGIQIDRIAVGEGAVVAVIGHNGAGKSTFAKCLCGLEKKCRGNLCINEKCYRSKERLRNCYLVMQDVNHQLFTESVLDEVLLSLNEDDREEHQKEEAAKEILRDMDLLEYAQAHPMALSGGQKQRCAIASAMASGRKIILFDEPTSGLDYRHMNQVAANLRKLGEMGKTVFVITHDLELIMKCCTDILHLENGTVEEFYPLNQQNEAHIQAFSGMGRKPETKEE